MFYKFVLILCFAVTHSAVSMVIDSSKTELNETVGVLKECLDVVVPTCGSDGNLYYSECDLESHEGLTKAKWSECDTPFCNERACPNVTKPACGSDGKIHDNWCLLLVHNCGKSAPIVEEPLTNCVLLNM